MSVWPLVDIVGLACASGYALAGIFACIGILIGRRRVLPADSELPVVSVLVSARNEERDLVRCIESLVALNYPKDKLEILIVNDRSTDGTKRVLEDAARRFPIVRALDTEGFVSPLPAKSRGIARAAADSRGQWLFITDADAAVHPGWIRGMLAGAVGDVGILCGPYIPVISSLVGLFERATVLPATSIAFGAAGYGAEMIPQGPNMAIRRDVYFGNGGLESVPFRLAEDIALWQLGQRAKVKAVAVMEPETSVRVTNVDSFTQLISQQRRWLSGGLTDGPPHIRWASALVGAYACIGATCTFASLLHGSSLAPYTLACFFISQAASMTAMRLRLRLTHVWRIVPVAFVYTLCLFVWLPLTVALIRNVSWRGRDYEIPFAR
jgi:cellulose synthase/poly-beta-1,6-N-acetylglucosamine synthase-like glycosyltransferase